MKKEYSDEIRAHSIELLLEGKTIDEVSEETGVNRNTLMSWRQQKKNTEGIEFPSHQKGQVGGPQFGHEILQGFKYTDDEIIQLVRQNPGYGVQRFCKQLYPKTRKLAEIRFLVTMLLHDYLNETGEDLLDSLQDPSFSTLVTESEYRQITGVKRLPTGYGRKTGNKRKSIADGGGNHNMIPLPPQEFVWGEIENSEARTWRRFEILEEEK